MLPHLPAPIKNLLFTSLAAMLTLVCHANEAVTAGAANTAEVLTTAMLGKPVEQSSELYSTAEAIRIAIIIDDIGYSLHNGLRAARLPAPLTLAVLPHTPNGAALAGVGHREGKEIMLHAPMANVLGLPLDRGALTNEMDQATFVSTLRNNIAAIPHVQGVNNHMGSSLTQNPQAMDWLMAELKAQQLFFVDSRTSAHSHAMHSASSLELPSLQRDIFLDNQRDPQLIEQQFERLLRRARKTGMAIAIGHPYPETLQVLEQRLPQLGHSNIELVPVSQLLPLSSRTEQKM